MIEVLHYHLKKLFPTGRAFRVVDQGVKDKFTRGIALSFNDVYLYLTGIFDSLLPDNDNFTEDDATNWERRYGLFVKPNNDLETRKDSILRKMAQPGTVLGKGSYLTMQRELQRAGFEVNVFENRFPDGSGGFETRPPFTNEYDTFFGDTTYLGEFIYLGNILTGTSTAIVANSIDPFGADRDWVFSDDEKLVYSFYISGDAWDEKANVPKSRENEFRQLILALKPTHTVAFLNVNYT